MSFADASVTWNRDLDALRQALRAQGSSLRVVLPPPEEGGLGTPKAKAPKAKAPRGRSRKAKAPPGGAADGGAPDGGAPAGGAPAGGAPEGGAPEAVEVPQPWSSYWLCADRRLEGWENLPPAFRWTLKLCADVVQTSVDDLMAHVRALECTALM